MSKEFRAVAALEGNSPERGCVESPARGCCWSSMPGGAAMFKIRQATSENR